MLREDIARLKHFVTSTRTVGSSPEFVRGRGGGGWVATPYTTDYWILSYLFIDMQNYTYLKGTVV
jgi:hypothetical protein